MQFIYTLVIAVAVLTILASIALVFGAPKGERGRGVWFLLASVGEVIWAVSIAVFLSLGTGELDYQVAPTLVLGIYVGALVMDAALLSYISWKTSWGKIISICFIIFSIALSILLACNPSLLYSEIILKDSGNSVAVSMSPFYIGYLLFFLLLNAIIFITLILQIRKTKDAQYKRGLIFFLIGLFLTGALSGIFDLILPLFRYDLIWVGPITIGLTILALYFAILKYKMVSINVSWLKILSAVVIISGVFIIYLLIFHLVFSALFRVPNPSYQVLILNVVMAIIIIALVPALSEIVNLTKSLIMTKQINLPYIVKKLSAANHKKLNLKDVSNFLAEYMHFSHVSFLVGGKFYGVDDYKVPNELLARIEKLPAPSHGAWQTIDSLGINNLKEADISRIAVLAGANGEIVGQMVLGTPTTKTALEHRDLVEIGMIASLMGTIIEDGGRSKS